MGEPVTADNLGELQEVVDGGYCVGCGACAAVSGGILQMGTAIDGTMQPHRVAVSGNTLLPIESVYACPFSRRCVSEDGLATEFLGVLPESHTATGGYLTAGVCAVTDHAVRARSSSGGFTRWVLAQLTTLVEWS